MTSIKRVFAAFGLAGVAALTQTGCDNQQDLSAEASQNPMNFAMAAKCPANPIDKQKSECFAEAANQAMSVLAQLVRKDLNLADSLINACMQPIGDDVPNNFDVQLQVQATDVKECFDALEKAAPAESKQEIQVISEGVKQGLARVGL